MNVSFHFVSLCFVTSIFFGLLHPVSEIFLYYSFHLLPNRNGFIKKKDVCFIFSFRFTLFRNEHIFWSVTSCFRDFPLYLIHFICYETEMGL